MFEFLDTCNGANTDIFRCLMTLELDNSQCINSKDFFQGPRRTRTLEIQTDQPITLIHQDTDILRYLQKSSYLCNLARALHLHWIK